MDQRSKNKVKLFRTLKVVFYCLGLPLFALAVVLTAATEYVGEFAYAGSASSELFASMKVLFNGTALYGVWIAAGVWLVIAISHIIITKTVKNRRARTFIVAAVTLVVMLVPVVVMDIAIPIRLEKIADEAPAGVTIASYEDEKGHFYSRTSASWTADGKRESYNYNFITSVENVLNTYNIGMYGGVKSGTADNTTNQPVTYGELFLDGQGTPYAGIDGVSDKLVKIGSVITVNGHELSVEQNADGLLSIGGTVFPDYYYGVSNGLWYRTSAFSSQKDGYYGNAYYNSNGMLSDGYVYGLDVALEILEDYYYSQMMISEMESAAQLAGVTLPAYEEILANAIAAREAYYTSDPSSYEYYLWNRQTEIAEGFTLTAGELENVLNALGGALGSSLGDAILYLLHDSLVGGLLGGVGTKTEDGFYIEIKDEATSAVTVSIDISVGPVEGIGDQVLTIDLSGDTFGGKTFNIGLDSRLISGIADLLDWVIANFGSSLGYDNAADLIIDVINGGSSNSTISTISTVLGIVGGLIGLDDILALIPDDAETTEDLIYGIVTNLLSGLYWYSSSEILPVYDFYVEGLGENASEDAKAYAQYWADYDRAVYEGGMHGYMIGSVLVPNSSLIAGDSLGDGTYSTSLGLADYASVMQLKTELTYKRWLYPLLGVRECLVCFVPFVVLFMILSGVAAEKEMLYATGQESAKKSKKEKKEEAEKASADEKAFNNLPAAEENIPQTDFSEENTATIVADENVKEVL